MRRYSGSHVCPTKGEQVSVVSAFQRRHSAFLFPATNVSRSWAACQRSFLVAVVVAPEIAFCRSALRCSAFSPVRHQLGYIDLRDGAF